MNEFTAINTNLLWFIILLIVLFVGCYWYGSIYKPEDIKEKNEEGVAVQPLTMLATFSFKTIDNKNTDVVLSAIIDVSSLEIEKDATEDELLRKVDTIGMNWLLKNIHRTYSLQDAIAGNKVITK